MNMTNGGFAAIAVALRTLLEPGDEAIFLSPPWFFYELLILAADGVPVRVKLEMPDVRPRPRRDRRSHHAAHESRASSTRRTTPAAGSSARRAARARRPAHRASTEIGHPIYILSDEPYRRIVFDGRDFHRPAEVYPDTIVTYSYGKQLLAPGMRIGYLTVPPHYARPREAARRVLVAQFASGLLVPERAAAARARRISSTQCISIAALEQRRDRLMPALREMGYETTLPEGTFYVMARSPIADDVASPILSSHRCSSCPARLSRCRAGSGSA